MARTKTYRLIRGGHRAGKKKFKQGDTIELKPRQARALVNKVTPVETQTTPAPVIEPVTQPSREEVIEYLTESGIEFDNEASTEELVELAQAEQG